MFESFVDAKKVSNAVSLCPTVTGIMVSHPFYSDLGNGKTIIW